MNDTVKKVAVIVVTIAAICVAGFYAYKMFAPPAMEQGVVHPSPAKSMAQMEKEREQREDAAAAKGAGSSASAERENVDLSGGPGSAAQGKR